MGDSPSLTLSYLGDSPPLTISNMVDFYVTAIFYVKIQLLSIFHRKYNMLTKSFNSMWEIQIFSLMLWESPT